MRGRCLIVKINLKNIKKKESIFLVKKENDFPTILFLVYINIY